MYLSKIVLDRRSPSVRQCLKNCQDMHRNVMKMFSSDRKEGNILYHCFVKGANTVLWLLSDEQPSSLLKNNGMKIAASREMTDVIESYKDGVLLSFELLAVPSKKLAGQNDEKGRRRFITLPEERMAWLGRKAAAGGFEIVSARENDRVKIYGNRNGKAFCFDAVEYIGNLRIKNEKEFQETYSKGIGPEKAYGCGMLLLMKSVCL